MKRPFSSKSKRGAHAPLTRPQKGYLSQLAKEAHTYLTGKGAIDEDAEEFRHRHALEACGRRISEAVNGDFELIEARFHSLGGKVEKALRSAVRAESNDERQARWKLAELCRERGLEVPALEGASVKRIWAVFYNIKNQPKRKAAKAQAPSKASLQAELARAVREERYEDAARIKRQLDQPAPITTPAEDDDEIPY